MAKEKTTACLMKVFSDMYEKPSMNNKVFLMKKLFHLKIEEGVSMVTNLNELTMIVNQLSYVEIDFDEKVYALILLASLPHNWDPMRVVVNNFMGSMKLNFNNVND